MIEQPKITSEVNQALNYICSFVVTQMDERTASMKNISVNNSQSFSEICANLAQMGKIAGYTEAVGDVITLCKSMLEREIQAIPSQ